VSAKLPVLNDQGVCWKDAVCEGPDGGGVDGLVRVSGVDSTTRS
jgi:hypothetical protein